MVFKRLDKDATRRKHIKTIIQSQSQSQIATRKASPVKTRSVLNNTIKRKLE